MKQVVQDFKTGVVSVQDVPAPRLRPGCVLVRNEFSLVSAGTEKSKVDLGRMSMVGKARARPDLVRQVIQKARAEGLAATVNAVRTRLDSLSPLGYSSAGVIVDVAADVRGLAVGDRVACAGGDHAFHAGVVCVPRNLCARVPDGVAAEQAAYTTVGCIALHGVRQSGARLGEKVLVIGLGLIGQLTVQMLKAAGCTVAGADITERQLAVAIDSGCESVVNAADQAVVQRLMDASGGLGFDAVIITAAARDNAPILLAGNTARDRGRIVVVGLVPVDVPRSPFYEKELSIVMSRSYGPGRYDPAYEEQGRDYPVGYVRWTEQRNMEAFLEMLRSGDVRVDGLTTHHYEVQEATRAYDVIANASEPYVGILLSYPREETPSLPPPASTALGTGKAGIVLVGAGSFATRVLAPALKAARSLKLEAVVTARGLSAVDAARKFGFAAAESSPEAAFARPGVGAVAIATRHDSHAELVVQALRAGLDVFVEKPLCISVGDLPGIVSAQGESGRICMVGFNRRFAPATKVLVGERRRHTGPAQCVVRVNAGAVPRDSWLTDPDVGGGRIVGELCHFIDLACHLVGSPPVSVSAAGLGADVSPITQDCLSVNLTHDDGSLSTVVYSAGGDPRLPKERVELFAGGAAAVIDDFRRATVYQDGRVISRTTRGQNKGHTAEVAAFVQAVATRGAVDLLPFHDCVRTTLATFAVVESLRTGAAVRLEAFAASVLGPGPDE